MPSLVARVPKKNELLQGISWGALKHPFTSCPSLTKCVHGTGRRNFPREVPSLTLFVRSFMHLLVTSTVIEVNKLPDSSNPNSPPLAPASQEPALVARIRPRKEIT
jgi:hypothetical protein